jgi:predicted AAA+ superfamily ATPase
MKTRALYKGLWDDLSADKAMVLLAGPRQSGKTTFARSLAAKDFSDVIYFNWDRPEDKRRLIADPDLLNIPAVQLVKKEGIKKVFRNGRNQALVVTAHRWLSTLP